MASISFTLHQLDAFRAVARYGSFSNAAKTLFISQPSLTSLVRNLEDALGVRLFDRTTRKVELTSAGLEFLTVVERTFSDLELAQDNLAGLLSVRRGKVVVGALPSASAGVVPRALYAFKRAFPDVQVIVKDAVAGGLLDMVRSGGVDFAIGSYTRVEPELHFKSVVKDEMHLVCRSDHRLAGRKQVAWSEIQDDPFIAMSPGTSVRHATDSAFVQLKVVKQVSYEVTLLSTMFGLARAGVGVTALPTTVLKVFTVDGVSTVPLVRPTIHRDIGFVTRRGREPSPAASSFMQAIAREISGRGETRIAKPVLRSASARPTQNARKP